MKKFISVFLLLFVFCLPVVSKSCKPNLNSVIKSSKVSKSSMSISVKDLNTGKAVFELNQNMLMPPASVQKMLTLPPAIEALGVDYNFSTELYSRGKDGYLIKLGADPYFKLNNLKKLISAINNQTVKTVYIDDSVIEQKDWGEGWQWDDDLNIHMVRFNSYNMDKNIYKITVMQDNDYKNVIIINPSKYPIKFINNVKAGDITEISVSRNNTGSENSLLLEGTVDKPVVLTIPTNNLKLYFNLKLRQCLEDRKIYLKNPYTVSLKNVNDKKITEFEHPVTEAINDILKNSNNMASETVTKLAAAKIYNKTGTDADGIKLFYSYCQKLGLDTSRIKIVDASGVSKNNLMYSDFITEYLLKNKDNSTLKSLATPGEGTLSDRMIPLKGFLQAKTGTLSDISGISGYLTSKSGKKYVFSIMINEPNSSESDKKSFEDYFIRELWLKG